MENYEKMHKEALGRAKEQLESAKVFDYKEKQIAHDIRETVYAIFPQLRPTEDEEIRKAIIAIISNYVDNSNTFKPKMIAWLEKQAKQLRANEEIETPRKQSCYNGEQDSDDEESETTLENSPGPKFSENDWTVSELDGKARQVSEVHYDETNSYYVVDGEVRNIEEYDRLHHLWTIEDAKDGDILVVADELTGRPFIFKECNSSRPIAYCGINSEFIFKVSSKNVRWTDKDVLPATKEQRDILYNEIANSGYRWDSETKDLKSTIIDSETPGWDKEDLEHLDTIIKFGAYDRLTPSDIEWLTSIRERYER